MNTEVYFIIEYKNVQTKILVAIMYGTVQYTVNANIEKFFSNI